MEHMKIENLSVTLSGVQVVVSTYIKPLTEFNHRLDEHSSEWPRYLGIASQIKRENPEIMGLTDGLILSSVDQRLDNNGSLSMQFSWRIEYVADY